MVSKTRMLLAGSFLAWTTALTVSGTEARGPAAQTTNDGIYSTAQANGAKAQFQKICADCHAFTVAAKKAPKDLPLGDEPFLDQWNGRPLSELITLIALTMPNDGSAVVSEAEAVDLVAYILQQNGYPAGSKPLTRENASAVVARPRK